MHLSGRKTKCGAKDPELDIRTKVMNNLSREYISKTADKSTVKVWIQIEREKRETNHNVVLSIGSTYLICIFLTVLPISGTLAELFQ